MPTNPGFRDLLSALNDAGAEYLIVGAHAGQRTNRATSTSGAPGSGGAVVLITRSR